MESLEGLKRTALCADLSEESLGQEVTLMGWCQVQRDLGGLIFISLRDRSGIMQLVVDEESPEDVRDKASKVRSEYVLAVKGLMRERENPNPEMKTGLWEIHVNELRILSQAKTPPFYIEEESDVKESLRLKHRYLDLRRSPMQRNLKVRSDITNFTRQFFSQEGFLDIETPMLGKSTPEGARDYLVPSRIFPGKFFALPQSPQLYKQLLMVSGVDRYFQIAKCFRDEDLRADRQPEFTQIDLEMSFVKQEDVMSLVESYLKALWADVKGQHVEDAFPRLTWEEAMGRFGSDKPDIRFGMELQDISDLVKDTEFKVFTSAIEAGGRVELIVAPGAGSMTRKEIDKLQDFVKDYGAGGLAWLVPGETWRGSILKFMDEELLSKLKEETAAKDGDLLLIVSDRNIRTVQTALGALRSHLGKMLELYDPSTDAFCWVTDFPLLEWDEEEKRFVAVHHPFTMPNEEDLDLLDKDPGKVRALAYDIVLNGYELGGGSIRIHDQDLQNKMFELLGFSKEQAYENFSFLLEAFQYGVPPHGGLAIGLDRLVMLALGIDNIKEVIAFPKVQSSADLMTQAPGFVSDRQLEDLGLAVNPSEPETAQEE